MLLRVTDQQHAGALLLSDPCEMVQLFGRKEAGFVHQQYPTGRLTLQDFIDEKALDGVGLSETGVDQRLARSRCRRERKEYRAARENVSPHSRPPRKSCQRASPFMAKCSTEVATRPALTASASRFTLAGLSQAWW